MGQILKTDRDWSVVDSEPCRVIEFVPAASINNGEVVAINKNVPHASVMLECKKLPQQNKGFITHKIDFENLWAAFKERGVSKDEEAIIFYSKNHLKSYAKILSYFMPKLWVMVCKKGAFELMTNPKWKPELKGKERWNAEKPIVEWKPEVMK